MQRILTSSRISTGRVDAAARLAWLALATAMAVLPGAALAADVMTPAPKATGAAPATAAMGHAPGQSGSADEAPQPSDKMTGRTGQATTAADAQSPAESDKVQGQAGATSAPASGDTGTAGVRPGPASTSTAGAPKSTKAPTTRKSGHATGQHTARQHTAGHPGDASSSGGSAAK